ncbi:fucose 4-O-acetylase-like acetyltransferase [Pseudoduganella flava]|uniref:Acyltransferase family protein n=1 Tax=Pseudoduganella flava TaxID=871742 RepID=A0A562Q6H5_9BURK|nr:acyltransferase [Pseudoduganella flava]QGZ41786.1 acyltransferase family protein [Pseudoduganella flava]TWI51790.1 fucose 4-O-acetylase-like acetyltransferase [Pseudoduganella flava]
MKRVEALDIAKGAAIICVVLGHVVSRGNVPGVEWYPILKRALYSFHMPLFMALSGMGLGLSWRHRQSWAAVGELVSKRIRTLLVPYLVFGVIIVAGKLVAQRFMHVDNIPDGLVSGIVKIILYPMQSASVFLWYIQVLAWYFLFVPWMMQYDERRTPWLLLALGIVLNQFEWTYLLNITGVVEYLPFLAAGILLGQHWSRLVTGVLSARYALVWGVPFAAAIVYSILVGWLPKWFVGMLSIPAVLTAAQLVRGVVADRLVFLGNHTLSIYLMNTIFIGLVKGMLMPLIPYRDEYFIIYFVVLSFVGVVLPVAVKLALNRVHPRAAVYI